MTVKTARDIQAWLLDYVARLTQVPAAELHPTDAFTSLGLDSVASVAMAGDLGDWIGRPIDPTLAYDHPSIEAVSRHIAAMLAGDRAAQPQAIGAVNPA